MPLNTIAYAEVLQTALDKKAVTTLTSGFMDANAGQVIYYVTAAILMMHVFNDLSGYRLVPRLLLEIVF